MKATSFSICKDCVHIRYCVLTDQKDKVWSCSDYSNGDNLLKRGTGMPQHTEIDIIND